MTLTTGTHSKVRLMSGLARPCARIVSPSPHRPHRARLHPAGADRDPAGARASEPLAGGVDRATERDGVSAGASGGSRRVTARLLRSDGGLSRRRERRRATSSGGRKGDSRSRTLEGRSRRPEERDNAAAHRMAASVGSASPSEAAAIAMRVTPEGAAPSGGNGIAWAGIAARPSSAIAEVISIFRMCAPPDFEAAASPGPELNARNVAKRRKVEPAISYGVRERPPHRLFRGQRFGQVTIRSGQTSWRRSSSLASTRPRTETPASWTLSGEPDTSGCQSGRSLPSATRR